MPFKKSNPGYTVKPAPVLEICALLLRGDAHHCPLSPIASEVLRSTSTWGLVLNSFYILYVYALGHVSFHKQRTLGNSCNLCSILCVNYIQQVRI